MKKWYRSKTLWLNVIGITAIILQCKYEFIVSPELEVSALAIINVILRTITNEGLEK